MQNYLDIWGILQNEVAGSLTIFIILMMIAIAYFAAKYRFPNSVMFLMLVVFILFISDVAKVLLPIIALLIAIAWAMNISRVSRD